MDAQLEVPGQSVAGHGVANGGHVQRHLAGKLARIPHVIHALVEASAELGSDRLDRNAFVGNGCQNNQQLCRSLREIGLVHRHFGDECALPLCRLDSAVDLACLLNREKEFGGGLPKELSCNFDALTGPFHLGGPEELRVLLHERIDRRLLGGFANVVGHVHGVEVAGSQKAVHGGEVDMVGVAKVGELPAKFRDRGIGCGADLRRLRTDDRMFPIGLVPHRNYIHARLGSDSARFELSFSLVRKSIAHANRESVKYRHDCLQNPSTPNPARGQTTSRIHARAELR